MSCDVWTPYFVATLATEKPATYHIICLDCYEKGADYWLAKVATKETITNDGLSAGYKKWASQQRGSRYQDHWEENIQATSSGKSEETDW